MRIVLVGVSCVGKTTVGRLLAERWGYEFIDFDCAVEAALGNSIERIKNGCFNEYAYRQLAAPVLKAVLDAHPDNLVVAMPPGGLFREYKSQYKKRPDIVTVALRDTARNILKRVVFYDEDSVLMEDYVIPEHQIDYYYDEIKADIAYYYDTHRKAQVIFNIDGRDAEETAAALAAELEQLPRPWTSAV